MSEPVSVKNHYGAVILQHNDVGVLVKWRMRVKGLGFRFLENVYMTGLRLRV